MGPITSKAGGLKLRIALTACSAIETSVPATTSANPGWCCTSLGTKSNGGACR